MSTLCPRNVFLFLGLAMAGFACESRVAGGGDFASEFQGVSLHPLVVKGLARLDDPTLETFKGVLQDHLEEHLDAGVVRISSAGPLPVRTTITFELLPHPEREGESLFHAALTGQGKDAYGPFKLMAEATETRPGDAELDPELRARLGEDVMRSMGQSLSRQAEILVADDAGLETHLNTPDTERLLIALREVGRRESTAHNASVRNLLVHPDTDVILAALAVLSAVRDRSSVAAIYDLTTSPNARKVAYALFALGSIGGKEAEQLLSRIASSHPDPKIRSIASESLLNLQKHKD